MWGAPWTADATRATTSQTTTRLRAVENSWATKLKVSDEEIDQIRRHADAVAHVIVEMFLEQRAEQG